MPARAADRWTRALAGRSQGEFAADVNVTVRTLMDFESVRVRQDFKKHVLKQELKKPLPPP